MRGSRSGSGGIAGDWVPTSRKVAGKPLSADVTLSASDVSAVPTTRTVAGKPLSADVTLSASDVSAVPATRTVAGKPLSADVTLSAADVSAVPTTRTVNGKALSADVTLTPSDIAGLPAGWTTLLDVDFAAQVNRVFSIDGTYTFAGFTWTKQGTAVEGGTASAIVAGTGLVLRAQTSIATVETPAQVATCTGLSLPLSQLFGGNPPPWAALRVWLWISADDGVSLNGNIVGVAVTDPVAVQSQVIHRGGASSGVGVTLLRYVGGTATTVVRTGLTDNATNRLLLLESPALTSFHSATAMYGAESAGVGSFALSALGRFVGASASAEAALVTDNVKLTLYIRNAVTASRSATVRAIRVMGRLP